MDFKIGHIELFVKDPLKSKEFYEQTLDFELTTVQAEKFVWLKSGELEILLRPGSPPAASAAYQSAASGLVLYTDDLPNARRKLTERGVELEAMPGEPNCYTFTDLDGNWFQLVDPGDH